MRQCKKQTTYAVIYKDGELIATGSNEIHADIKECPREMQNMKSDEGYHLCKEVCRQKYHAEVDACLKAGKRANGATLYLLGHTCCCDDCIKVMNEHGIAKVVIADKQQSMILKGYRERKRATFKADVLDLLFEYTHKHVGTSATPCIFQFQFAEIVDKIDELYHPIVAIDIEDLPDPRGLKQILDDEDGIMPRYVSPQKWDVGQNDEK
jgi:deoxycytidylate deaminase